MAETKANQFNQADQGVARREREKRDLQSWSPSSGVFGDPFEFMSRISEEMDRAFDRMLRDFGMGRRRAWLPRPLAGTRAGQDIWAPRIEAFQKGDRFIVRAELPGLRKDDVQVELIDDALTIRGERRAEHEEEREGYYHSEREYGEFYRSIPLPEGVISESAQAAFRDGVLEVTMQAAPAETSRGRRLEIKEGSEQKK